MDFDKVLTEIGEFGRFQRRNYLLICLPVMFAAANSLSYVFTAGIPKYRCFIPECDNVDEPVLNPDWIQNAVPGETTIIGGNEIIFTPKQCLKYKTSQLSIFQRASSNEMCPKSLFNQNEEMVCDEWVFDTVERTIVQEWNITCSRNSWKLAMVGTIHFAGLVVGTASSGFLADRFGRKIIFTFCIIFMSITGVLQGVAWDYKSFLVFAFLNAVGTSGVYPLAFIIGVEMVGPARREMASIVMNYFYAVGEALVGLYAWWHPHWKFIQFGLSAPPILCGIYYWLVPESVRWLIAKREHEKACVIIKKAAKTNRKTLSESLLYSIEKGHIDVIDESNVLTEDSKKHEMRRTIKQTLQSRILIGRFTVLLYLWATNAIVYYGLSLNSTNLSGNKYINFILVCLVEIPGYSLAWIAMNKIGRRWSSAGSMLLCAFTCAAGGFVNQGMTWAVVTLFLIGKLGVTSSFTVVYTHTAEMLPTIIRSGGVGCMSTVARFGAMIAPFIPLLGIYYKPLPLLFFGLISLIGGLLCFILPETWRQKLPDTVEEAERLGKKNDI